MMRFAIEQVVTAVDILDAKLSVLMAINRDTLTDQFDPHARKEALLDAEYYIRCIRKLITGHFPTSWQDTGGTSDD